MSEPVTAQTITIRRVYDAPREAVWRAWTEPDQIASWWGPHGWSIELDSLVLDVRPGGAFGITSISDADGTRMRMHGTYGEIDPPTRLVLDEAAEGCWHDGATSVLTLTELGDGRTEMTLEATINTDPESARGAEAGMTASIERLGDVLRGRSEG